MNTMPLLEAREVNQFLGGNRVISDLSISVPQGEVYGFLGRNGAGKSTVMKILLGLLQPETGEVFMSGRPISTKDKQYLSRIGSLIEEPSFYPNLTGAENIRYISRIRKTPSQEDRLLKLVGLSEQANKKAGAYSLGMKQRLGIALALVGDPDLLLLDEPTNGLDPEGIREIRQLILHFSREMGKTVLVSSHILSEIEHIADVVGIIHHGRIRYEGPLQNLSGEASLVLDPLDEEQAKHALLSEGIRFRDLGDKTLSLPYQGREDSAYLINHLVNRGVEVASLKVEKRTLEDSFLAMTGERNIASVQGV